MFVPDRSSHSDNTYPVLVRMVGGAIRVAESCGGDICVCGVIAFLVVTFAGALVETLTIHPPSKVQNMETFSKDLSAAFNQIPSTQSPTSRKLKAPWEEPSDSDAWTDTSSESSDSSDDYDDDEDDIRDFKPLPSTTKPTTTTPRQCSTCKKDEKDLPTPLKHCAKCKKTLYCSRECQTTDWKPHKQRCGKAYLQSLPEKDVFAHLVDAYRLRIEDEYVVNGDVSERSLYGGGDPVRDFQRFLDKAEKRDLLLPDWWDGEKRAACVKVARDRRGDHCVFYAVEKSDIRDYYGNPLMPMQLRMLADKVYGRGVVAGGLNFA